MMFIFADLWLLLFCVIMGFTFVALTELGSILGIAIAAIMAATGLNYLFDIDVWTAISDKPSLIAPVIAVYLIVGAAYTVIWRWPDFLRGRMDDIQYSFESWVKANTKDKKTTKENFTEFTESYSYTSKYSPARNKERLSVWIMMWPMALAWELMHRPITWAWNATYDLIANSLNRIGLATVNRNMKFKD